MNCHSSGAIFPESFLTNVDRLILSLHPKYQKKSKKSKKSKGAAKDVEVIDEEKEKQRRLFPGLSMKDQPWQSSESLASSDKKGKSIEVDGETDDLMNQLEGIKKRVANGEIDSSSNGGENRGQKRPRGTDESIDGRMRRSRSPDYNDRGNGRNGGGDDRGRSGYGNSRDGSRDDRGRNGGGGGGNMKRNDDKPILYKVYRGKVSSMKDFGAFISLEGIAGRAEGSFPFLSFFLHLHVTDKLMIITIGMVHIGSIGTGRITHPSDLLSKDQQVYVKVMSVAAGRLSLSMKDADQRTGADLSPHLRIKSEEELQEETRKLNERNASGSNNIQVGRKSFADDHKTSSNKRLTSPERWEIQQMIASGAASAADYPGLDEDFLSNPNGAGFGGYNAGAEADEELDIEINENEAPFLSGQTKRALELSPVKIVKAPDGGLNRAALAGASLAKERRELKAEEAAQQADSETRDLNTPWLDPMTQSHERTFAADARGQAAGEKAKDVPAWKKETFNQATTFGKITSLSIQDQRKSLPIFGFKEQLLQAFNEVSTYHSFDSTLFRSLTDIILTFSRSESNFSSSRRNRIRKNNSSTSIFRRSRLRRQAQDRMYSTSSSSSNVSS